MTDQTVSPDSDFSQEEYDRELSSIRNTYNKRILEHKKSLDTTSNEDLKKYHKTAQKLEHERFVNKNNSLDVAAGILGDRIISRSEYQAECNRVDRYIDDLLRKLKQKYSVSVSARISKMSDELHDLATPV